MRLKYVTVPLLFVIFSTLAEGTKQLRPTVADHGYINLFDQQNNLGTERTFATYNATDDTRLNIRVEDPANEVIYMGFQTDNTDDLYYRIKDPNGNIVVAETLVPQVDGVAGKILDYTEAVAGPSTLAAGGYLPITILPVPGLAGDYSIEFRDPTHNPPGNYGRRHFDLFDITVANTSTNTPQSGRLWSKAWDITTTGATRPFNGSVFIYTNDGITTQVTFDQFEAWSFIIQSNNTGPANTGDVLADRQSIDGGVLLPDYKIFLTEPDPASFPVSQVPEINGVPDIDLCDPNGSYCIELEVSNEGVVEYVIDVDGAAGYDHPRDVKLTTQTVSGMNCLPWDGLDGQGNTLSSNDTFDIMLSYQAGITHLILHDAENNPNGFNVNHISPPLGLGQPLLYYDDTAPVVGGGQELGGCLANCHQWNSNFGNNKTINTWWVTYFENDTIKNLSLDQAAYVSNADIQVNAPVDCEGNGLELEPSNLSNEGASPTYNWWVNSTYFGAAGRFSPNGLVDGDSITLVLTSSAPCTANDTASYVVTVFPSMSIDTPTVSCDKFNGEYTVSFDIVGGTPDYTISGGNDAGTIQAADGTFLSQPIAIGSGAGNYSFTITDANGCGDTTFTSTYDCACDITGSISADQTTFCEGDSSLIEVTLAGGVVKDYTVEYSFTPLATSVTSDLSTTATSDSTFELTKIEESGTVALKAIEDSDCRQVFGQEIDVTVHPNLQVDSSSVVCDKFNTEYTVSFDISGGTPSYTISGGNDIGTIQSADGLFTSQEIGYGAETGNYSFTIADAHGCGDTTFTSNYDCSCNITGSIAADQTDFCEGDQASLNSTVAGGQVKDYTIFYTFIPSSSGTPINQQNNLTADGTFPLTKIQESGKVTLLKVADSDCETTINQEIAITVNPLPGATLIGGGSLCDDGRDTLAQVSITKKTSPPYLVSYHSPLGNEVLSYVSDIGEQFVIDEFGNYSGIEIVDTKGCEGTVDGGFTLSPVSPPLSADAGEDVMACDETIITDATIPAVGIGTWSSLTTGVSVENPTLVQTRVDFGAADVAQLVWTVSNGKQCPNVSDTVEFTVEHPPAIDAGEDKRVLAGEKVRLNGVTNSNSFLWYGDTGNLTDLTVLDPLYTTYTAGEFLFTLEAKSEPLGLCVVTDDVVITVQEPIEVPNVFTPNDDGQNDVWEIVGLDAYSQKVLKVFNRWGNVVYESEGTYVPWDGKRNGTAMPVATYYWIIELGEEESFSGAVTILR